MSIIKINKIIVLFLFFMCFHIINKNNILAQDNDSKDKYSPPKIVTLNFDSLSYQSIFGGDKEKLMFHSGYVILDTNQSVGEHNTKNYEEMIIVLEGEGSMIISGKDVFPLKYGTIGYCPPNTEHNITNTGSTYLKYIYVAAKTK